MAVHEMNGEIEGVHAYAFAAWVLLCRPARDERPTEFWSPVLQVALDEFLEAYPERDAEGKPLSVPDRLACEPDRAKLRAYFTRIHERRTKSEPWFNQRDPASWWWRVAKAWNVICGRFKFGAHAYRPNPLVAEATPESARAAFARYPGDRGPDIDSDDAMRIEAGLRRRERLVRELKREKKTGPSTQRRCSGCGEWHSQLRPEDHILNCALHLAWKAWEPVRDALWILDGATGPEAALARESTREAPRAHEDWYIDYSFEKWTRGEFHDRSQTWSAAGWVEDVRSPPRVIVGNALREWERMLSPPAACPLCREPMPFEQLADHLWTCDQHPALAAVERHGPKIDAALLRYGELRIETQAALRAILRACHKFSDMQGWNGEETYSKAYAEKPWLEAIAAAEVEVAKLSSGAAQLSMDGLSGRRKHRAVALRGEIERLIGATASVAAACRAYWRSAHDDYNPSHSAFPESAYKSWSAALKSGQTVLDASDPALRDRGAHGGGR